MRLVPTWQCLQLVWMLVALSEHVLSASARCKLMHGMSMRVPARAPTRADRAVAPIGRSFVYITLLTTVEL